MILLVMCHKTTDTCPIWGVHRLRSKVIQRSYKGHNMIFSLKLLLVLDALSNFNLIWTEGSLTYASYGMNSDWGQRSTKGHYRSKYYILT